MQLNDTHPEHRRRRADAHPGRPAQFPWDEAWKITVGDLSYTNHTLLPEALETWPVESVRAGAAAASADHLPHQRRPSGAGRPNATRRRRLRRGLADRREVRPPGADGATGVRRLAPHQRRLGDAFRPDEGDRVPRSQSLYPGRIVNKTNGITFRRWLMLANPRLTAAVARRLRRGVLDDPTCFARLEALRRRQRVPAAVRGGQARQQDRRWRG